MDNKKVPGSKISSLIALLLVASSVAMGSGSEAEQDSWLAMTFATGAALLLAWLYSAILRLRPGKNLFDISEEIFGKIGGKIISGLYVAYVTYLGARIFNIYDNFIRIVNLDATPTVAILLFSVPLIAGTVKCGLKTLGSCAKFVFVIAAVLTVATLVLGLRFMNFDNIKPILAADPKVMFKTTASYLTLPMGEAVLFLSCFGEIDKKESPFKILSKGILLGGLFLTAIILRNILLLGAPTCRQFVFTSYDAVGIISLGDFVTRISVIIGVELTLTAVAKLCVFVYTATQGVSKVLGLKKFLQPAAPCCALMAALSLTLYTNILTEVNFEKYVSLIDVPFQIILPIVILIVGKIRLGKQKKGAAPKTVPTVPPAVEHMESD